MFYLRLDELPALFDQSWAWSARGWALGQFRRKDFFGDPGVTLDTAVRNRVQEETGHKPRGPIYMLANLRYFGFIMNPICCYYCYAEDGKTLEAVVAEVNNTPWNERHSYVLQADPTQPWLRKDFAKEMHVSPFHPMEMMYHWNSNTPGSKLVLHLGNSQSGEAVFDASLALDRRALNPASLRGFLFRYPFMTAKVCLSIYWQALRLWLKGVPFYSHPNSQAASLNNE
jgi:DUF1365 family protein